MRKYLFQSCRNNIESIKDTDTYMIDTALLLIEPVTLIQLLGMLHSITLIESITLIN